MKAISHKQSRRNSARRRRKVKARHARARRSRARSQPVFGAGRVHYEIGARVNAMSYGIAWSTRGRRRHPCPPPRARSCFGAGWEPTASPIWSRPS